MWNCWQKIRIYGTNSPHFHTAVTSYVYRTWPEVMRFHPTENHSISATAVNGRLLLNLSTYLWLYSPWWSVAVLCFLILFTVRTTPWTGDQPFARTLSTHRTPQTQNKCTQTSMPWVGFEPAIPAFERPRFHFDRRPPELFWVIYNLKLLAQIFLGIIIVMW
jgi:hypothetical protein